MCVAFVRKQTLLFLVRMQGNLLKSTKHYILLMTIKYRLKLGNTYRSGGQDFSASWQSGAGTSNIFFAIVILNAHLSKLNIVHYTSDLLIHGSENDPPNA